MKLEYSAADCLFCFIRKLHTKNGRKIPDKSWTTSSFQRNPLYPSTVAINLVSKNHSEENLRSDCADFFRKWKSYFDNTSEEILDQQTSYEYYTEFHTLIEKYQSAR